MTQASVSQWQCTLLISYITFPGTTSRHQGEAPVKVLDARAGVCSNDRICDPILSPEYSQNNEQLQCSAYCAHNEIQHQEERPEVSTSIANSAA